MKITDESSITFSFLTFKVDVAEGKGWETAYENSSDPVTNALLKKADLIPSVEIGLRNITRSIYWRPYAFLGPKEELKYIIKTNFTPRYSTN